MRALKIVALALALFGSVQPAAAQAPESPAASPAPATAPPNPATFANVEANYALGLGDVIEVAVVGQAEYTARVRVSPDGSILLPLIGSLQAVNLRPTEVASQVAAQLAKGGYYSQPVVRVEVITVASRYVTVLGQVGSPGLIPLDRAYRLSEVLARVGARFAGGAEAVILTRADGTQQKLQMAALATGTLDQDPVVLAGDKIYVPPAENQVFYVSGSVRSPGAFPMSQGMTVRTALARAGGVNETGNEKKFEIFRNGQKVKGAKLESEVEVGDIIKFGERMF